MPRACTCGGTGADGCQPRSTARRPGVSPERLAQLRRTLSAPAQQRQKKRRGLSYLLRPGAIGELVARNAPDSPAVTAITEHTKEAEHHGQYL